MYLGLRFSQPGSHGVERCAPRAAPGACVGPCFCVVFAFLAWPCTGRPKHTSEATPPRIHYKKSDIDSFPPSPPLATGSHPYPCALLILCSFLFWSPLTAVGWGPFCSGRDLPLAPPCPACPSPVLTTWVLYFPWRICPDVTGALVPLSPKCMFSGLGFFCTCVSVRRRDRCTRTFSIRFYGSALSCFVHAPPPGTLFQLAKHLHLGQAHYALHDTVCAALCLLVV